jgi:phage antirepressor YoqD-like protein
MVDCAQQRELIAALQERNAVHVQEKAAMARRMADMEAELRTLRGGAIATAAGGQA